MSAPITKVVKNDAYSAPRPPVPVAPTRPTTSTAAPRPPAAAFKSVSRTLQHSPAQHSPAPPPPKVNNLICVLFLVEAEYFYVAASGFQNLDARRQADSENIGTFFSAAIEVLCTDDQQNVTSLLFFVLFFFFLACYQSFGRNKNNSE